MSDNTNLRLKECMAALGFSELESRIYLTLLKGGRMSAYQIAKKIDVSRPSVYNALEQMTRKGMTERIPNDTALYVAQRPEVLLASMRHRFARSAAAAETLFQQYAPPPYSEQYANLTGFDTICQRVKELLRHAEGEIYINTDMRLDDFSEELAQVGERGLRVIVYSFYDLGHVPGCEIYTHGRPITVDHAPSRLMVVLDNAMALMAGPDSEGVWQATVSGSRLFVKILSEHIHNDIYLLKLRDKFGRAIYEDIHIATDYETRNRQ